jgi:ornithine carbamoyltransferase
MSSHSSSSNAHSNPLKVRHFVNAADLTATELRGIIDRAKALKQANAGKGRGYIDPARPLAEKTLAMVFEKSSTRTRVSFEMAMHQLGGSSIVLQGSEMQLGRGETIADTARVLSRYVDAIMIRSVNHSSVLEMAKFGSVPVINALTDRFHPCQMMADVMTFEEHRGPLKDKVITWVGDGNNMAATWIQAAVLFGCEFRIACPPQYAPRADILAWAKERQGRIHVMEDPAIAVQGSDCVIADTWISMGNTDGEARLKILQPYQVNDALMAKAKPDTLFMHCLPAFRGREVTTEVIDGPHSVVWDEAENRLHVQKAILLWCFGL